MEPLFWGEMIKFISNAWNPTTRQEKIVQIKQGKIIIIKILVFSLIFIVLYSPIILLNIFSHDLAYNKLVKQTK